MAKSLAQKNAEKAERKRVRDDLAAAAKAKGETPTAEAIETDEEIDKEVDQEPDDTEPEPEPKMTPIIPKTKLNQERAPVPVPGEATVTMIFPREVRLTRDDGTFLRFRSGVREVPASVADHWYLAQHGVTKYKKG